MAEPVPADLIARHVAGFAASPLGHLAGEAPWALTAAAERIVAGLLAGLGPDYRIADGIAVHHSATVETGATLKGPLVVGPDCLVAAGAYLRGGAWLDRGVIIGPGAELKSAFVFAGAKLAHLNFVGDSILGAGANLEAGSIVANFRNERPDPAVWVRLGGRLVATGARKFGALIGDHARIGANAVLAPGAVISPGQVVPRLGLIDPEIDEPAR